jgi:hypothetical protein
MYLGSYTGYFLQGADPPSLEKATAVDRMSDGFRFI